MKTVILVAAHKPYTMPKDPVYLPVFVGAAGKTGMEQYTRDDTGHHISDRNPNYCELTGLYWAWKNLYYDALGLCHYRRHFITRRKNTLTGDAAEKMLQKCPVWLPKKRHYWIETNKSQYEHAHHAIDLQVTKQVLEELHPEAVSAWNSSMAKRSGHRFNMFLMTAEYANQWCSWLFPVLFEVEKRLDLSQYSVNDARVFGFLGERLMDVWLEANHIEYRECRYRNLESQHWVKKINSFLRRKFFSHK